MRRGDADLVNRKHAIPTNIGDFNFGARLLGQTVVHGTADEKEERHLLYL